MKRIRCAMPAGSQGERMYSRRFADSSYIALEGPDGVGKSSVAAELKALVQDRARGDAPTVRIRHFPTEALVRCAREAHRPLRAEDYLLDMENWLSFRPEPVSSPNTPTPAPNGEQPGTLCILDRWALSTAVYADLRGEAVPENAALTLNRLNRVPLTTFVLLPRDPALLTDPDYGADNGTGDDYDPRRVTEAYRRVVECALGSGALIPIAVDRARDTPGSVAADIVERLTAMGVL